MEGLVDWTKATELMSGDVSTGTEAGGPQLPKEAGEKGGAQPRRALQMNQLTESSPCRTLRTPKPAPFWGLRHSALKQPKVLPAQKCEWPHQWPCLMGELVGDAREV